MTTLELMKTDLKTIRIPRQSGTAFELKRGQILRVIDPEGEQVSDMVAFNALDREEYISSGRTLDYASKMFLSTGDLLYSNRSNPMLRIGRDDVGRHDFTLSPCSREMFRKLYDDHPDLPGCQGNLEAALSPYGIAPDRVPGAFNIFMYVDLNGTTGDIRVLPPKSRPGDATEFEALMDLVIGLTACSAAESNNHNCTPIDYQIIG